MREACLGVAGAHTASFMHPFQSCRRAVTAGAAATLFSHCQAGKAGWIAGTSFLILIVPLIIEMDREQQVQAASGTRACQLRALAPTTLSCCWFRSRPLLLTLLPASSSLSPCSSWSLRALS